jgi:hypothetical protein
MTDMRILSNSYAAAGNDCRTQLPALLQLLPHDYCDGEGEGGVTHSGPDFPVPHTLLRSLHLKEYFRHVPVESSREHP